MRTSLDDWAGDLTVAQRFDIAHACTAAGSFDDLPDWVRTMVEQAEARYAAGTRD